MGKLTIWLNQGKIIDNIKQYNTTQNMPIPPLRSGSHRSYGDLNPGTGDSQPPRKKSGFKINLGKSFIKKLLGLAIIAIAAFFIFMTALIAYASRDLPDPNKLSDRQVIESTKIYDRTGTHLLYEVYQDQKRTMVNMDQISPWVPKAVVAVEDKYFYTHSGVRWTSVIRAVANDVLRRKSGSGGASTITQQLIKNAMIGNNPGFFNKLDRKIKEWILAPRLEKKYKKDEILKMYLNEIPFGSTNYGIEAASQSYLHKSAKDLTLPEAATLAGMIQRPSYYLNNPDALKDRRNLVLRLMADQGIISEDQKKEAQAVELKISKSAGLTEAPHFVLYIKQLLADQFGEVTAETGGLKVITSLDYDKQKIAEQAVKENGDKFAKTANANNAALVAIDPKTAQILAMVGSRDYNDDSIDGQFNVAVLGKRQPGSSFKPFVYTAAFEKGFTPETVLYDVLTDFDMRDGSKYIPKNYDGKEHGLVTMRKALQGSLNIPAVKTLYLVGTKNMVNFAERFGYTTFTKEPDLTMVLGGYEVNLLEHTNAYATLADDGVYHKPVSILKVTDSKNNTLYEWKDEAGTEALKPELAALTSSVLSDDPARAYMFGLHSTLTLPDRPVAAKTGTTNDYKDAWTMGYTPSLAAGVWVGNSIPSPMKGGGNTLAGSIWNQFMRQALKGTPVESFPTPPTNDADKAVLRGGDGGITLKINTLTGNIAASSTPENLVEQKTYLPPHDILYYVNKDDPRGPAPENPANDPQYQNWENALADWVARQAKAGHPIAFDTPPSQTDPEQDPALAPTIQFNYPHDGDTVGSRQFDIQVNASAPRGVYQVSYFLDDTPLGNSRQYPFNLNVNLHDTTKGNHVLKAIAQDDQGNSSQIQLTFNMTAEMEPASAEWVDTNPLQLKSDDFPRAFFLTPILWKNTNKIEVYLSGTGDRKLIYSFTQSDPLTAGKLNFTWKHSPGTGDYTLNAFTYDNTGHTVQRDLQVIVR